MQNCLHLIQEAMKSQFLKRKNGISEWIELRICKMELKETRTREFIILC